jgi:hypothetical protein
MLVFGIPAMILIVVGALLIFAPRTLEQVNEVASRVVARVDERVLLHRIGMGILLWVVAVLVLVTGFYGGF